MEAGKEKTDLQKCLEKIDQLMETIKKKDEEIEALREHQIYLETELPPKGKRNLNCVFLSSGTTK